MIEVLAHITQQEVPSIWLVALASFIGGFATAFAMLVARSKWK
jgi:hypothetical protein